MTIVREFETTLFKRSMKFDAGGGVCYPFVSGYMISFLEELAEQFPELDEKIQARIESMLGMMEESK